MEIVSEPDLTGPDMAFDYLNSLKDILMYGGISDCDMEKGMVRCDVNVSVRPKGQKELGAKIEIKNMNSFSGGRRALEYEIPRQIDCVEFDMRQRVNERDAALRSRGTFRHLARRKKFRPCGPRRTNRWRTMAAYDFTGAPQGGPFSRQVDFGLGVGGGEDLHRSFHKRPCGHIKERR